jgi:hypothetical protein
MQMKLGQRLPTNENAPKSNKMITFCDDKNK